MLWDCQLHVTSGFYCTLKICLTLSHYKVVQDYGKWREPAFHEFSPNMLSWGFRSAAYVVPTYSSDMLFPLSRSERTEVREWKMSPQSHGYQPRWLWWLHSCYPGFLVTPPLPFLWLWASSVTSALGLTVPTLELRLMVGWWVEGAQCLPGSVCWSGSGSTAWCQWRRLQIP